jgi:VanZ family protein
MPFILLWGPVVLQMAIIFGASSLSNPGPLPGGMSDKGGHFLGYVILSLVLLRALAGGRAGGITWRTAILAVVGSTLYGVSDEVHQYFVPGRTPDVVDVMADALGAGAGVALGGLVRRLLPQRAPAAPGSR